MKMSIWEAMTKLEELVGMLHFFGSPFRLIVVDMSDPDFHAQQSMHAYLTAESLRKRFPEDDWLHLIGLLHDMGKVLSLPSFGLPQWAVVGDTFPVGCVGRSLLLLFSLSRCSHDEEIVHHPLFEGNADNANPAYNSAYGIYEPHCGLDNLKMSWGRFVAILGRAVSLLGHDEYLYQWAIKNQSTLPPMALKVIRFHSFYAWHNKGAYKRLLKPEDDETLVWVKRCVRARVSSVLPYSLIGSVLPTYTAKLRSCQQRNTLSRLYVHTTRS
jgi:inositol oxygenase